MPVLEKFISSVLTSSKAKALVWQESGPVLLLCSTMLVKPAKRQV